MANQALNHSNESLNLSKGEHLIKIFIKLINNYCLFTQFKISSTANQPTTSNAALPLITILPEDLPKCSVHIKRTLVKNFSNVGTFKNEDIFIKHEEPTEIVDNFPEHDDGSSTDVNLFDETSSDSILNRKRKLVPIKPYSEEFESQNQSTDTFMVKIHTPMGPSTPKRKKRVSNEVTRLYEPIFFLSDLPDRTKGKPKRNCAKKPKKYNVNMKADSSSSSSEKSSSDGESAAEQTSTYKIDYSGEHLPTSFDQGLSNSDNELSETNETNETKETSDDVLNTKSDNDTDDKPNDEILPKEQLSHLLISDVKSLNTPENLQSPCVKDSNDQELDQLDKKCTFSHESDWTDTDNSSEPSTSSDDCVADFVKMKPPVKRKIAEKSRTSKKLTGITKNTLTDDKCAKVVETNAEPPNISPTESASQDLDIFLNKTVMSSHFMENEVSSTSNQAVLPQAIKMIISECLEQLLGHSSIVTALQTQVHPKIQAPPNVESLKKPESNVKSRDIRDFFKVSPKNLISTGKTFEKQKPVEFIPKPNTDIPEIFDQPENVKPNINILSDILHNAIESRTTKTAVKKSKCPFPETIIYDISDDSDDEQIDLT